MPYDPLNDKLIELETHLRGLNPKQRDAFIEWIKNSKEKSSNLVKAVKELSNCMDTLRVHVKYTVFDLEATRRENQQLQEVIAHLQAILIDRGYYADQDGHNIEMGEWAGDELPEAGEDEMRAYHSTIGFTLPEAGDFIHSTECDHPYDAQCWCEHCEACRTRYGHHGEGAD